MKEQQEIIFNQSRFYITVGINEYEKTEYIQLNEEGVYKPTPVIFISRPLNHQSDIAVSMHYEGLAFEIFTWFINHVKNIWNTDLTANKILN